MDESPFVSQSVIRLIDLLIDTHGTEAGIEGKCCCAFGSAFVAAHGLKSHIRKPGVMV
jgi:hypothetical protein